MLFRSTNSHNCGLCDVCLNHRKEGLVSEPCLNTAKEQILLLLTDRKPHPITDLRGIQLSTDELDTALTDLLQEEYISQQDGFLQLV